MWDTLAKLEQQAKEADEHGHANVDELGFEERAAALGQQREGGVTVLADAAGQEDGERDYSCGVE